MGFLDNDFIIMNSPKHKLDAYLSAAYGLQYYGTGYGKVDGELLPKIDEEELLKVFEKLKIHNPKY